jgi:hypothetical protein
MFLRRLIAAPKGAVWAVVAIALTTTALVCGTAGAATAATAAPPGGGVYGGTYSLENEWSHRCLDEKFQDGPVNNGTVQVYQCSGDAEQSWELYLLPGGNGHTYQLVNVWSGLCLDARLNGINRNGSVVQVYACRGAGQTNQLWSIPLVSGAPVWVTNRWTGFTNPWPDTLDEDRNGGGANGSRVQLWQLLTAGTNQEWRVVWLGY